MEKKPNGLQRWLLRYGTHSGIQPLQTKESYVPK